MLKPVECRPQRHEPKLKLQSAKIDGDHLFALWVCAPPKRPECRSLLWTCWSTFAARYSRSHLVEGPLPAAALLLMALQPMAPSSSLPSYLQCHRNHSCCKPIVYHCRGAFMYEQGTILWHRPESHIKCLEMVRKVHDQLDLKL